MKVVLFDSALTFMQTMKSESKESGCDRFSWSHGADEISGTETSGCGQGGAKTNCRQF